MQRSATAVLVRLSHQLKKNVQRVAQSNRRSTVEEIRIALERHVAAQRASQPGGSR